MHDIVLIASSPGFLRTIITTLSREFSRTDLSTLYHFLGNTATRDNHGLFLSNEAYGRDILQQAFIASSKTCTNPKNTPTKHNVIVSDFFQIVRCIVTL